MGNGEAKSGGLGATSGIAFLIALIPVASTLPAYAWPASEERKPTTNRPPSDQDPKPAQPSSTSCIKAAPAYVWDANSAKAPGGGPGPASWAALPPLNQSIPQLDHHPSLGVVNHTPWARIQRGWLTCRYAHAPPFGA